MRRGRMTACRRWMRVAGWQRRWPRGAWKIDYHRPVAGGGAQGKPTDEFKMYDVSNERELTTYELDVRGSVCVS
jgi:hypothetical protein